MPFCVLFSFILFQFTPLREGRQQNLDWAYKSIKISIHAPPRGATKNRNREGAGVPNFNSRPSARGDLTEAEYLSTIAFQFTPLREGRPFRRGAPGV